MKALLLFSNDIQPPTHINFDATWLLPRIAEAKGT
jgi:hypothetical protein